jgi:hypothetical protein
MPVSRWKRPPNGWSWGRGFRSVAVRFAGSASGGQVQGSLHCATDGDAVRRFGRGDVYGKHALPGVTAFGLRRI